MLLLLFFFYRSKTRWPPRPLFGWDFSTSSLKPLNRICRNLMGSKITTSTTKFVGFFGPIRKNKMAAPASDYLWHFRFFSETAELNLPKLDWKQELNFLYQRCVFGSIWKTKRPPWYLIGWDIFEFSEIAERNLPKLDRKQEFNVIFQFWDFLTDRKTKITALADSSMRHIVLMCMICSVCNLQMRQDKNISVCNAFNIKLNISWANINIPPYLVKRSFSLCTYYSGWM